MDKQVRPGPGRRSYLHAACGAACWHRHRRHRRAAAIKRQAYAFELRFGLGMSAQAHDGTKPMQHACRPAKATQEAERRQLLHDFSGPAMHPSSFPLILPSPSVPLPTPTQVMALQTIAALLRQAIDVCAMTGGPRGNRHGFGERRKGWRD